MLTQFPKSFPNNIVLNVAEHSICQSKRAAATTRAPETLFRPSALDVPARSEAAPV